MRSQNDDFARFGTASFYFVSSKGRRISSSTKLPTTLRGQLLVSCQAAGESPRRDSAIMARLARAGVEGGAAGIRASGIDDVRAIRLAAGAPIVGIGKERQEDGEILITPSLQAARQGVAAGADRIALDGAARGARYGALDRLQ